jgi:hypothetical protein
VVGLGLAFICLTISAEIGGKKGERSQKKILTIETKMYGWRIIYTKTS